jgi:hypothetical protein
MKTSLYVPVIISFIISFFTPWCLRILHCFVGGFVWDVVLKITQNIFFVIFHVKNVTWHFFLRYTVTIAPMNCTVPCTQLWLYAAQNWMYCLWYAHYGTESVRVCDNNSQLISFTILLFVFVWFSCNIVFSCVLLDFFYFVGFQLWKKFYYNCQLVKGIV